MTTAEEIIVRLEVIEKEPLNPIEFARRSAAVFNEWAEENPGEVDRLTNTKQEWMVEYTKRIRERVQDIPWEVIFPNRTTQEDSK